MPLKNLGVSEMTESDMISIEGGSWLSRAWTNICGAAGAVAEWVYGAVVWISNHFE
jgi:hypothetical protein